MEDLLIGLILEGKVDGRIDQVGMRLELDRKQSLEKKRYAALEKWTEALEGVHAAVVGKTGSGGGREAMMGPGADPFMALRDVESRWG